MSKSLAIALLLLAPATLVAAAPARRTGPQLSAKLDPEGRLAIGGVAILQLPHRSVCESVRQRGNRITARLVEALWRVNRKGRFWEISVKVAPPADEPWIVIEGVPVMKVTVQDAAATKLPVDALARHYAALFRKALRRVYTT